ncbi:hypothetical protein CCMSSC00406_0009363 [Pleurotus cornucopiae]|uniref:Uncharacterized protein n=1 Tax=Pleurotus cornucopiae TaxID=5321 RepID=A0ACB7ITU3_PLECO|nr:hypothetical protein CCMSSC00406_0009363 [Pleurotus cornucopiae]
MKLNIAALDSLQKHRGHVASVIADVLSVKKGRKKLSEQVKTVLERFGREIDSIVLCEGKKRNGFVRFLMSDEDMTEIQEIFDKVGRLIAIFVLEITLAGHLTLAGLSESIKGTQCTENDMLRLTISSRSLALALLTTTIMHSIKSGLCLPGTRIALLEEIGRRAVARDEAPIYLLTGHAGFGKSTIVRTVAERLDALHILGASFFFSSDDAQLKKNSHFFSTLAYQLCVFDELFAKMIGNALESLTMVDAVIKSPAAQLEKLIVEPLKPVNAVSHTVVIVVDTLDECGGFDSLDGEEWRRDVWDGLAALVEKSPFIRVFFTSRPHQHLTTLVATNPRLYQ